MIIKNGGGEKLNKSQKTNNDKQILKKILETGLGIQAIGVVATFALKKNKVELLRKLRQEIENFVNNLRDDEKKELREDLDLMLENKADEFTDELLKQLDESEMQKVADELKTVAS